MTNTLIREISAEYHFKEKSVSGKNYISFIRYYANGWAKVLFYEDLQILYLSIIKLPYKKFQMTAPTHEADIVYRVFKNPNQFKNASK